jgi:hypothetical protein
MINERVPEVDAGEFNRMQRYFAKARDAFGKAGYRDKAVQCDQTIALLQEIESVGILRPVGSPERLI